MKNECVKLESIQPTEENHYSLFQEALEQDPQVFFHTTAKRNLEAIANQGFKSSLDLGSGQLASVSYTKKSSSCLAHIGTEITDEFVVLAVRFETLDATKIVVNMSDIHVFSADILPSIIGYCDIPKGFMYS